MKEKMNNQKVESTDVEVVEEKENWFVKQFNKAKAITLGDVAKGAALFGLGALTALGISKAVSGVDEEDDTYDEYSDVVEEPNEE